MYVHACIQEMGVGGRVCMHSKNEKIKTKQSFICFGLINIFTLIVTANITQIFKQSSKTWMWF